VNLLILPDLYKESSLLQISLDFEQQCLDMNLNLHIIRFSDVILSIPSNKIDDPFVFIKHQEYILKKIQNLTFKKKVNIFFIDYFQPIIPIIHYFLDSLNINVKYGCLFFGASFIPDDIFFQKQWMKNLDNLLLDTFNIIYVPSEYAKEKFPYFAKNKIKVLPFHFNYNQKNINFDKDKKDIDVIIPIRWSLDKGIISCINICKNIQNIRFLIISNKPEKNDFKLYELYIEALKINNLKIIDYVAKEEYFSLLSRAKIVFLDSKQELFGFSLREAMSKGCIPLVGNRCCYPEILPEKYLFNSSEEAIMKIRTFVEEYPSNYIYPKKTSFNNIIDDFFER